MYFPFNLNLIHSWFFLYFYFQTNIIFRIVFDTHSKALIYSSPASFFECPSKKCSFICYRRMHTITFQIFESESDFSAETTDSTKRRFFFSSSFRRLSCHLADPSYKELLIFDFIYFFLPIKKNKRNRNNNKIKISRRNLLKNKQTK